jgi:signal transduction histidine kinase
MEAQHLPKAARYAVERHRLLRALDRARREEQDIKDRLFSHVSHELRSPLNVIYQFTSILLDGLAGDLLPKQREYVETVYRNAHQLTKMIGDLFDVTRAGTGVLRVEARKLSLETVVLDVADEHRPTATSREVSLEIDIAHDLPAVLGDPERLRQVLTNLVDNALKFTPPSGEIRIRARLNPDTDSEVLVSVKDTGVGIPTDALELVFERLHQEQNGQWASRKGLGLGLYICRELITRHGGRIWATSEDQGGSTLWFTLLTFREEVALPRTAPAQTGG